MDYGPGAKDYMTDVLTTKVDDYIRSTASGSQPFFIYLATYNPHEPATPAPRYANLFDNLQAPRIPSFDQPDVSTMPPDIRQDPHLSAANIQRIDQLYRNRVRSMQAVDDMLVSIVNTLQQTGQLENTYIMFTSDNGYHLGSTGWWRGKPRRMKRILSCLDRSRTGIPPSQVFSG